MIKLILLACAFCPSLDDRAPDIPLDQYRQNAPYSAPQVPSWYDLRLIERRIQRNNDWQYKRRQIRNHGAGGCTPNFSTGGCL